ncbi:MAG: NAD(P)/FAD-dependent oxidoreductase [Candidatus Glassbacteria bacterium]
MRKDFAIVGAGPSGAACAVQMKRSGLDPVVYERCDIGGTIRFAYRIENYPGFPWGISGLELADLIQKTFERWKISTVEAEVVSLSEDSGRLAVSTEKSSVAYRCVIIATGTRPKRLNGVRIEKRAEENIVYDVLAIAKGRYQTVGILGGGDVALDYALHLSESSEVHVFHRHMTPRSIPLLFARALEKGVIFHETKRLETIRSAGDRIELLFRTQSFLVDALLPSIGREPVLDFIEPGLLKRRNELTRRGRLFFIGDVVNGPHRQVAIAAGDGLRVAMEVYERWK